MKRAFVIVFAGFLLAACGGGDGGTDSSGSTGNQAPTLSGNPLTSVVQNSQYSFAPSAADADGDTLSFTVANLPSWATFDTSTGQISGMPGSGDVGSYSGITITVSDGQDTASLGPFSIDVVATGDASVTLSWTAPTQRTDGSALTDLAGYKIYWGTSLGNYTQSATLDNPGLTTYVVDGLTPATWYFVATAYDSNGIESSFSNPAFKTVN